MIHLSKNVRAFSISLLDRFYSIFLFMCIVLLTIGVPFVFHRKLASAAATLIMTVAVLMAWRMSRRGQPQKSLKLFAVGLWVILVSLIYAGLPPVTAGTAIAMAVMLAVVVHLRAGVIFGASYLLAWLSYIVLQSAHLTPPPYFPGSPLTGWIIGAVAIWLVLLPIPELVRNLHKAASLQRAVIEATADGILVVNNEGKVETYNQRFVDFWHIPPAYLNTRNDSDLLDFVAHQLVDPDSFLQKVRDLYAHPDLSSFDTLRLKDGRLFERHSQPQRLDVQIVGRVWSFRDVTEREKAQAEIHRLAFHDSLTMLPNRRLLNDRLEQTIVACKRNGQNGALLFLDMDNFKPLNDSYGHGVGDMLLVEVARRITSCVRQIDTVVRFGGDEFVVILGKLDTDLDAACFHAHKVAEKIRHALAQPYHLIVPQDDGSDTPVLHRCTSSIGIAMFSEKTATADDVLKQADLAMYRSKDSGRNAINFYESVMS
jgi:diguanylate cyclase (GGDEF)-like protein